MSHGARSNPSFARSSSSILCTHLAPFPLRVGRESSSQRHEQPATAYSPHFAHCSPVPCAPPCSAGMSAEAVPSVSKHLQPTLVLHCAQRAIQSCLMRADAARRPRVAGSFGVPPADVLWSRFRGVGQGRQCPRPARGAARRGPLGHTRARRVADDDDDRCRPPPPDDHRRRPVAPPTDRTTLPPTTIARRRRRRRSPTTAAAVIAVTQHPS